MLEYECLDREQIQRKEESQRGHAKKDQDDDRRKERIEYRMRSVYRDDEQVISHAKDFERDAEKGRVAGRYDRFAAHAHRADKLFLRLFLRIDMERDQKTA